jgi:hypothetical protein
VGTPQGYPVPLRRSRDDDAKAAVSIGPLRQQPARERLGISTAFAMPSWFQSDKLPLSTWLVAPNSTSATAASFRSEVEIGGCTTRVVAEQTAAVDPSRRGENARLPEPSRNAPRRRSTTDCPGSLAPSRFRSFTTLGTQGNRRAESSDETAPLPENVGGTAPESSMGSSDSRP